MNDGILERKPLSLINAVTVISIIPRKHIAGNMNEHIQEKSLSSVSIATSGSLLKRFASDMNEYIRIRVRNHTNARFAVSVLRA